MMLLCRLKRFITLSMKKSKLFITNYFNQLKMAVTILNVITLLVVMKKNSYALKNMNINAEKAI